MLDEIVSDVEAKILRIVDHGFHLGFVVHSWDEFAAKNQYARLLNQEACLEKI